METRGIITIEEKTVVMPDTEVWMTTGELASLFYVRGVSVEAAIRKLKKEGVADGGSCRHIRLNERCCTEVYGIEMVIALSFRFDTGQAALFRKGRWRNPRKSLRCCSCIIRAGHIAEWHRHGIKRMSGGGNCY